MCSCPSVYVSGMISPAANPIAYGGIGSARAAPGAEERERDLDEPGADAGYRRVEEATKAGVRAPQVLLRFTASGFFAPSSQESARRPLVDFRPISR